jgi:hypothetical protein
MKCIFGCRSPAVAVYILPRGCVCFRDRIVQALCAQHEHKCTPLGRMILVASLMEQPPRLAPRAQPGEQVAKLADVAVELAAECGKIPVPLGQVADELLKRRACLPKPSLAADAEPGGQ